PLAGISGVNEAQISISLHQHYSLQTNWNGNLPFIISEKVLSEANSIERALEIIKEAKVSSAWAFIVTDGKTRDGFVFEKHPKGGGVRWLADNGDLLTHTNFFQSQECRGTDYATTERMNWDNFWRNETLQRRIRPKLAELTPELAVQYLSDHYDGFWQEEKVVNRTVSQVYNIQSYVLDPVEFKLLLAEGDCPIHMGEYREYDLGEIFSGKKGQTSRNFLPYQFQSNAKASAKRDYILSFVAAFDDDFEKALVRLENSLEHSFSSEAALVAALINVRLQGSLEKSFQYLDRGAIEIEKKVREKSLDYFPPEYFEVLLYQARLCDLMGKREKAVRIYQQITHHSSLSDRNIRSLAQKARPYKKNRINRILMPYSSYIPFD
ncbi:MAG: hypothetical protein EB078_06620, partial [Proteobacteria bacterium]|nr:hypothetical protein [Pseudomonadota bacterium]